MSARNTDSFSPPQSNGGAAPKKAPTPAPTEEKLRLDVKLTLARGGAYYGPGVHQLLHMISEKGSIRDACTQMGISYSKGWRLINRVEQVYGYEVLFRQPGGKHGGRSVLTERGAELLDKYDRFMQEATACSLEIFKKYFKEK